MTDEARMKRKVTPDQMARLSRWSRRKPVIALMGEFSTGKSTLMNLLVGENILPTQITATRLPPVWLRYGTEASYRVDLRGRKHPVDWNDTASIPIEDTRYIRLYCEAEILGYCDLIDTPGISDPSIPLTYWIDTIRYANSVMWCTHAAQAWRESERRAWLDLPERLRATSVLLITRKDRLRTEEDMLKVDRRLAREAGDLFNARIFISPSSAVAANGTGNAEAWQRSGAQDLLDKLDTIIEAISMRRGYMLARYDDDTVEETAGPIPEPVESGGAETVFEPFVLSADDMCDVGEPAAEGTASPPQDDDRVLILRNFMAAPGPGEPETAAAASSPAREEGAAPAGEGADREPDDAEMYREIWEIVDRYPHIARTLTPAKLAEGLMGSAGRRRFPSVISGDVGARSG